MKNTSEIKGTSETLAPAQHPKERPILFSTPMVEAEQAGRKTMTRRVRGLEYINKLPHRWRLSEEYFVDSKGRFCQKFFNDSIGSHIAKCPYGQPGDLLWVRETWYPEKYFNGLHENFFLKYKADFGPEPVDWNWKPSIFMPKAVARIWLRVVDVRVERLQEISEGDAIAEGIESYRDLFMNYFPGGFCNLTPIPSFHTLWQSINGEDSWDMNPWVWVVEFEQVDMDTSETLAPAERDARASGDL